MAEAGSLGRVSAVEIEDAVRTVEEAQRQCNSSPTYDVSDAIETVERVVVAREELTVCLAPFGDPADKDAATQIRIPRTVRASNPRGKRQRA
jgi:hypothetical protein